MESGITTIVRSLRGALPGAVEGHGEARSTASARRRLERIAVLSPDGLFEWDFVTGEAWYSARFSELLGAGQTPLPPSFGAFQDRVHAEDLALLMQAMRRHLEQREPLDVEFRAAGREGEVWLRLRAEAERDAIGAPRRTAGTLTDVTNQRRALAELRRTENRLRRALDGLDAAVGVLDADGLIVEINHAWREGAGEKALFGLRFGFGEEYAPALAKAAERTAGAALAADGVAAVLQGRQDTFAMCYVPEGDLRARRLRLQVRAVGEGRRRVVVVTHEEALEPDEADGSARELSALYELILDSVPLQIAYVRRDGEFAYANAAYERWFGLPSTAIEGRRLQDIVSAENYAAIAPRIEAVLAGEEVAFETTASHGEDGERELAVAYLPHFGAAGSVEGFFSVVRDVTSERRLETGLRHAQKMEAIGRLTGGIAHDFNNLLNVIIGNLQLLERPLAQDARLLRNAETALRAALRGADLTRRLLAFSRQQRLEPQVCRVESLLKDMRELIGRTLGRGIEVDVLVDAGWPVRVDPGQFEDALLNLAINARDAMPDGGKLTISARDTLVAGEPSGLEPGDYVIVEVADTGTGMSADVLKRAFEPFFTTKQVGKGTGLGLAMVYGFAQQSGGTALVCSEPGRGTTVALYFPRAPEEARPQEAMPAPAQEEALPRGSESILIVEDEPDLRVTTRTALSDLGYRVREAASAAEALRLLRTREPIDLVFSDVVLPGATQGTDLVRQARELRPGLKFLLVSGFTDTGVLERALAEGVVDVMAKPYSIEQLAGEVRALLDGSN